jgi:hypothetical protein
MTELFVDCENTRSEYIVLIGVHSYGHERLQLHSGTLTREKFMKYLNIVKRQDDDLLLFCHGPDIGRIERFFEMDLKTTFHCINTVTAFKNFTRYQHCSQKYLEECFGLPRVHHLSAYEIDRLWNSGNKKHRQIVLDYNWEDCVNLRKLVGILKRDYGVTRNDFKSAAMF